MSTQQQNFKKIADAIRKATNSSELITPNSFADKVAEVYDSGKKSEYDRFWNAYQENGKRTHYLCGFSGRGWTTETFKPKYDLMLTYAYMLFRNSEIACDLVELLTELGIKLDFSKTTDVNNAFANTLFTHVGEINLTSSSPSSSLFWYSDKLETVDKLIVKKSTTYSSWFTNCYSLKNIIFEGTIANNLDIHWSPLSKESIQSLINTAENSSSFAITLSLDAVNAAFESNTGANDGESSDEWASLIATKQNVTISLI